MEQIGLCLEADGRPVRDPETYETTVPGVYVAGSLAGAGIDIVLATRDQASGVISRIADRLAARNANQTLPPAD